MNDTWDYWTCDNCHRVYTKEMEQVQVRIQQRTERVSGVDLVIRPVETLVICRICEQLIARSGMPDGR